MSDELPHSGRHSYPLSILFLLIAASAVISALLAPVVRFAGIGGIAVSDMVAASLCGGALMAALGAAIGLYHYRPTRGCLWGIITGCVLGIFLGPVSLAPVSAAASIFSLTLGGSVILVAAGLFFRFASRNQDDPVPANGEVEAPRSPFVDE